MASLIEDYALIGNTRTAALVGKDGSIDWLCLPRFDSPACFAALLGEAQHGRWLLAPTAGVVDIRRSYRDATLVLETDFETADGAVRVIDCMPLWEGRSDLVRVIRGLWGQVTMRMELIIRFDYGSLVPWVHRLDGGLAATAGPDALELRTIVDLHGEDFMTVAEFTVSEGQWIPFVLSYFASHESPPLPIDPYAAVAATAQWWQQWAGCCSYAGQWREAVLRSLITLKALTYAPTGGIVAAVTTSLPEQPGGVRNWDYRFCWLRDATFTLYALLITGYREEAGAWREWLLRAAAGRPQDLQILYGIAGERRLSEMELSWLPGYQGAAPVRIGNAASRQFQLDVYGEVMDTFHLARSAGLEPDEASWQLQRVILDHLESVWQRPDEGIWEVRGRQRHFTYSKVMAWVAMDRAVKAVERFRLDGPVERWRCLRKLIHEQICRESFDAEQGAFVQYYGSKALDASLLLIPLVGFLPPGDPRVGSTVAAIERELTVDGLVQRYRTTETVDGLPPGEGVFLPCSFWLADNLALLGHQTKACELFERLLELRNDVGLLSEQYDSRQRRLLGNFPQAFTHVALINTARNLSHTGGPSEHRGVAGEQLSEL
jgi:GH15 family glucan-1,4-alpha-glucosidase